MSADPYAGTRDPDGRSMDEELVKAIAAAEDANIHSRPCQACQALRGMSELAREQVERALAGTIGEQTLADILTRNGYPTGRRAIATHRREDHTP